MDGFQLARPDAKVRGRAYEQTSRQEARLPPPPCTSLHLNFLRLHPVTTLLRLEEVRAEHGWGDQWVIQSLGASLHGLSHQSSASSETKQTPLAFPGDLHLLITLSLPVTSSRQSSLTIPSLMVLTALPAYLLFACLLCWNVNLLNAHSLALPTYMCWLHVLCQQAEDILLFVE